MVTRLGGYRVLSRLRAGGMATLYLAAREGAAGFVRPVAIKILHPHLARDAKFVKMFIAEARLSARIDDPHVARTEELGQDDGQYFLVLEYVDGCALSELLRVLQKEGRALTPSLAVWITMQIAAGLHAAHETTRADGTGLGIVHRDVSPQNVLLAFRGHVKVIDFGVAKAFATADASRETSLHGKLAYMSPEHAKAETVDRRSDVYALGIVLWEMLTMRRLFQAPNDFALLDRVRAPHVPPPSSFVAGISPALEAVVMRALAADPAARPESAAAFADALAGAMPESLSLTGRELAALLAAVMPDALAVARTRMQALAVDAPIPEAPPARETLATMTIPITAPSPSPPAEIVTIAAPARTGRGGGLAALAALALVALVLVSLRASPGAVRPMTRAFPHVVVPSFEGEPARAAILAVDAPSNVELPEAPPAKRPRRAARAPLAPPAVATSRVVLVDGVPIADRL